MIFHRKNNSQHRLAIYLISSLSAILLTGAVVAYLLIPTEFTPVLPAQESIDSIDGTFATSPNQSEIFTYQDTIDGVKISVSQQLLTSDDKITEVANIAKSYNAANTLDTKETAYIGSSTKGPQTVIFSRNELLIFIQSDGVISDSDWVSYIDSLN